MLMTLEPALGGGRPATASSFGGGWGARSAGGGSPVASTSGRRPGTASAAAGGAQPPPLSADARTHGRRFFTDAYEAAVSGRPKAPSDGGGELGGDHGGGPDDPHPPAPPPRPPAFSIDALLQFSVALGSAGLTLRVLTLDYTPLGDVGLEVLSRGLRSCAALRHLSLARCDLTATSVATLGAVLIPDALLVTALAQPQLESLTLRSNPLGPAGLRAVAPLLRATRSLQFLHLGDVGVLEEDSAALQALAEAALACPSLTGLDLDQNYIGDTGAALFLQLLELKPSMYRLRLATRVSRRLMAAIAAQLAANLAKKGKKGRKGGKK
jgi:hypothetical protein